MDYKTKAINCVKDTALPVQMRLLQECSFNLDTYCQKYGQTEASFCECSRQGMIYVLENMMPEKSIKVEIIETVLSGASKCRFKVTIE